MRSGTSTARWVGALWWALVCAAGVSCDAERDAGAPADVEVHSPDAGEDANDGSGTDVGTDLTYDLDAGVDDIDGADVDPDLPPALCPNPRPAGWHACEGRLFDAEGRVVLLRGVNVSQARKTAPYDGGMTDADLALMRQLGFNHIRLVTSWAAVMPTEGTVDPIYLARLVEEIRRAATYEIWVVVDSHQDLFGEAIATDSGPVGNGAPAWACPSSIAGTFTDAREPWFLNYGHEAVVGCFDHLYDSPELQDQFASAWAAVAEAVGDEPNVVGYDLWNEPFFATQNMNTWEGDVLLPLYERLATAILDVDPDAILFSEPGVQNNLFGFSNMPRPSYGNAVFAPHLYDVGMESGRPWDGSLGPLERRLDDDIQRAHLMADSPVYVGEWGPQSNLESDIEFVNAAAALLDEKQLSWAAWQWGPGTGYALVDGEQVVSPHGGAMARPYPARFAGEDLTFSFDPSTRTLQAHWVSTGGPDTVFAVPAARYPDGTDVAVSGATLVEHGEYRIAVRAGPAGSQVEVSIAPSPP